MPALTAVPAADWWLGVFLLTGMIALLISFERIYRRCPHCAEALRKLVHLATGLAVLPALWLFTSPWPLLLIAIFFAAANFWSTRHGKLKSIHAVSRPSLGTFYYPVSVIILLLVFWERSVMILTIAFALMAFGDAAAGLVAGKISRRKILPLPWDQKSLQGSAAMLVISILIIAFGLALFKNSHSLSWENGLHIALAIGVLATAAEALSDHGSDNLTVPLLAALGLFVVLQPESRQQFLLGEILAMVIVTSAFFAKALDLSGAIAGFLIGTFVFGLGGWMFAIPMLLFFIGSSLLSKLPQPNARLVEEIIAKSARRDAAQVLANGLLPALMAVASLLIKNETAFLLYLGGLAAATADTWATEIGLRFGKQPRSISTGKWVAPGISGGITFAGVLGAFLGAVLIALAGYLSYRFFTHLAMSWLPFIGVTLAGIIAQFIDSLLGATLQRRNRCVICEKITERSEHCGRATNFEWGWRWLDNDVVNIVCGISGVVLMLIFLLL